MVNFQIIEWDQWGGRRGYFVHANAGGEVISFDVLRGVGKAFEIELGADEVPGGARGTTEERVDRTGADADIDAGDCAGGKGEGVVGGVGAVEEGLEPSYVLVAGYCQCQGEGWICFRLTARVPITLSGLACHRTQIISMAHWRAETIIWELDFQLEMPLEDALRELPKYWMSITNSTNSCMPLTALSLDPGS